MKKYELFIHLLKARKQEEVKALLEWEELDTLLFRNEICKADFSNFKKWGEIAYLKKNMLMIKITPSGVEVYSLGGTHNSFDKAIEAIERNISYFKEKIECSVKDLLENHFGELANKSLKHASESYLNAVDTLSNLKFLKDVLDVEINIDEDYVYEDFLETLGA